MPKCKFCQTDIKWKFKYNEVPTGEKNLPYNLDGSLHDCRPTDPRDPSKKIEPEYKPRPKPVEPEISPIAPESAKISFTTQEDPMQVLITELTKHTHLLQEILEAMKK